MYSAYNEGKSVVVERCIRSLKNKIFNHMSAVSKNVLDDIVDKYNNTVHRTIKMRPIDVTSDSYAEYNETFNLTKPKFKVSDHNRISKYKNIFDTLKIGQKKFLLLVKLKTQFRGLKL